MLTDDEIAYMRETQDEARPTRAVFRSRVETPDGMGGADITPGEPVPVTIRVAAARNVPDSIAQSRQGSTILTVTMDLALCRPGDTLTVTPDEEYEIVSDGSIAEWTTAQRVYAVRLTWPNGGE